MLELTIGAIAAALIAKALGRAEDKAVAEGEGALRRLVELVRGRFNGVGEEAETEALARLEDAPDSKSRVEALARLLDERAQLDPGFGRELDELVAAAKGEGVDVHSTVQNAYGPQSAQIADVRDSEIRIEFGNPPSDPPPRISD